MAMASRRLTTCVWARLSSSAITTAAAAASSSRKTRLFTLRWINTLKTSEFGSLRDSTINLEQGELQPIVQHVRVKEASRSGTNCYDMLLSYPGGMSTDLEGERVFISDTLHNRIIITSGDGEVVDCIGSTTGFADGPFESAQLCCPASTVFDTEQNCLFIADCENHAVRKADLSSRVLETVYPVTKIQERASIFQRWLRWLGLQKAESDKILTGGNEEGEQKDWALSFPWHLAMASSGHLMAASHGFGRLWMIDVDTGAATEAPCQEPHTMSEQFLSIKSATERVSKDLWVHLHAALSSKGWLTQKLTRLDIVSRVATLKNHVFLSDAESHQILKMELSTGNITTLQLSNLGLLGLPSWWSLPVQRQVPSRSLEEGHQQQSFQEHIEVFQVQPGKCLLCVDVTLPRGTSLADRVDEGCLWRQGRGSLVELSVLGGVLSSHQVGIAHQFLVDVYGDSLEEPEEGLSMPEPSSSGLPFYSMVDVSLGTGEVVFDAVLYLKHDSPRVSPLPPLQSTGYSVSRNSSPTNSNNNCKQLPTLRPPLIDCKEVREVPDGALFLKHLHLRVRLEASEHAPQTRKIEIDVEL